MNKILKDLFSIKYKIKFVFLIFSIFSILGIVDASNSLDHLKFFQNIGLSLIFLAGFLDGSYAEKNIHSIKDLLSEGEEVHVAVWWVQTVGFWLFFFATALLVIRYFSVF